jgi:hypothetical protein
MSIIQPQSIIVKYRDSNIPEIFKNIYILEGIIINDCLTLFIADENAKEIEIKFITKFVVLPHDYFEEK